MGNFQRSIENLFKFSHNKELEKVLRLQIRGLNKSVISSNFFKLSPLSLNFTDIYHYNFSTQDLIISKP